MALAIPFDVSGVFAPGQYQLLVESRLTQPISAGIGDLPATFQFQLQAVPEPGSALLLAAGLAMLGCRRTRWS